MSKLLSKEVVTLVLAGGEGVRLKPLTDIRCKPALSFGGRYRLIDIALSNAINADFTEIYVLSQFLASSLNNYLLETYQTDTFYLELLTPEQTFSKRIWYEGTADAVRKNIHRFLSHPAEYFVILSGDQIYSMDLKEMLDFAKQKDADLTIATLPVGENEAKRMGVLKIDSQLRILDFLEKPATKEALQKYAIAPEISAKYDALHDLSFLGSMGIYIFKRKSLMDLLRDDPRDDFGKHLIPTQLNKGGVYAYPFSGYWEDIGTISSYHNATLNLAKNHSCLDLYNERRPIYTQATSLPSPHISNTHILQSILCDGSMIAAESITRSMIGMKTSIQEGTVVKDSVLLGWLPSSNYGPTQIGKNCAIERAIIDEGVTLGDNVTLTNQQHLRSFDSDTLVIRDGIIIVKAGVSLPPHFSF